VRTIFDEQELTVVNDGDLIPETVDEELSGGKGDDDEN
jgi:hypothetical protein